jgi:hypothetical protein
MQLHDAVPTTGALDIILRGPDGRIKQRLQLPNLVVDAGKAWMAARMVGTPAAMSHMALGSGTVAPAAGNTTLGAELGRVALAAQSSAGKVSTYSATFGAGVATGAVTEAGILNAAANGTLLNRATFPVVNKEANDTLQINWTVTQN